MKNLTIPALIAAMLATSAVWAAATDTTSAAAPAQQPPQSPMATLFAKADANHDGKLDSQEFAEFQRLRDEFMAQHHPQFATLDKNGDGFITQDELRDGRMGPGGMHGKGMRGGEGRQHDSLFIQADTDHNGTLSQDEYQKFVELGKARRTQKGRAELTYPDFASLDTNKDGQLDREELHNGMRAMYQQMKAGASAAKPAI